jgi:hypothetical protein
MMHPPVWNVVFVRLLVSTLSVHADHDHATANVSLLLSTNKTGIQFKCHSPTPSPSKSAMSTLGDFDGSTSFHPLCTSSPSAPRTLKITTGVDDDSFAPEDSGLLPSSSSWLGCHPPTSELKGTWSRSPAEQENDYIGSFSSV